IEGDVLTADGALSRCRLTHWTISASASVYAHHASATTPVLASRDSPPRRTRPLRRRLEFTGLTPSASVLDMVRLHGRCQRSHLRLIRNEPCDTAGCRRWQPIVALMAHGDSGPSFHPGTRPNANASPSRAACQA